MSAVVAEGSSVVPQQPTNQGTVKTALRADNPAIVHVRELFLSVQVAGAQPQLALPKAIVVRAPGVRACVRDARKAAVEG